MSKADRSVLSSKSRCTSQASLLRTSGAVRSAFVHLLVLSCVVLSASDSSAQNRSSAYLAEDGFHSPFAIVAEKVMPAVVAIRTLRIAEGDSDLQDMFREYFRGDRNFQHPDFDLPGAGSGFVMTADGLIITNNHVVAGADEIGVMLPGHETPLNATVVGTDPATDLAVIKVEFDEPLPYLTFGSSDEIRVGDWAIAIGNPLGELEGSLTVGVISAKGRADLAIQGANMLRYQDFLQTDAAINPGNSGGPLLNIRGEVIGVNTAVNRAGQGIGFAIPTRLTEYVYGQLVEHGRVRRGYLGVTMSELSDERARGTEIDAENGVYISEVRESSPASEAGVERGDILTEYNGEPIWSMDELRFRVAESPVGSTARLGVRRDGRSFEIDVVLAELDLSEIAASIPDVMLGHEEEDWLGLIVRPVDSPDPRAQRLRDEFDIQDEEGVLVVEVTDASPAAEARIEAGDIIVEIDGDPISGMPDYVQLRMTSHREYSPDSVAFLVRRGDMNSYFQLTPTPPAPVENP